MPRTSPDNDLKDTLFGYEKTIMCVAFSKFLHDRFETELEAKGKKDGAYNEVLAPYTGLKGLNTNSNQKIYIGGYASLSEKLIKCVLEKLNIPHDNFLNKYLRNPDDVDIVAAEIKKIGENLGEPLNGSVTEIVKSIQTKKSEFDPIKYAIDISIDALKDFYLQCGENKTEKRRVFAQFKTIIEYSLRLAVKEVDKDENKESHGDHSDVEKLNVKRKLGVAVYSAYKAKHKLTLVTLNKNKHEERHIDYSCPGEMDLDFQYPTDGPILEPRRENNLNEEPAHQLVPQTLNNR